LESLASLDPSSIKVVGVQPNHEVEDARFDPHHAAQLAYAIIGVIEKLGGATKFIDWVIEKTRDNRGPKKIMQIKVMDSTVEVYGTEDPKQIRASLNALLRALPR
jgi:hypothetical protein